MGNQNEELNIHLEDAFHYIVECLRRDNVKMYGYEMYLPIVMRNYVEEVLKEDSDAHGYLTRNAERISPPFYAAAWELCRRGIIRPGLSAFGGQATEDGGSGNGYSITPTGQDWLNKAVVMTMCQLRKADLLNC